jgi:methionyl-tRNA synthetase
VIFLRLCQDLFLQLNDNGFMFTEPVEQLYCENCQRYLADRFVEGGCPHPECIYPDARGDQCDGCGKLVNAIELKNPRCKICRNTPKLKTSSQFFIDLPKVDNSELATVVFLNGTITAGTPLVALDEEIGSWLVK